MPQAEVTTAPVTEATTDAVLVVAMQSVESDLTAALDVALDGAVAHMRATREWTGRFAQRVSFPALGRLPTRRVMLLGLGQPDHVDLYRVHNALQLAARGLRGAGVGSVTVHVEPAVASALGVDAAALARAIVTGVLLANADIASEKSDAADERPRTQIERVVIGGLGEDAAIAEAVREAVVLAEATNVARRWAAMPSNLLTPTGLAAAAARLFEGTGLETEVIDKAGLERMGAGALLGVAQGSDEPPVMITVRHDGGRPGGPCLALVGKGITFDTGGISIKPAAGMEVMKYDMGGGAAVLAAMWAIARLAPAANVIGVVPATENMPGGRAYKPGDVLRSMSGKTIEVLNTDAEGRIILADGLAQARAMGATHIVDCATLTGAAVVALGHVSSALMTNDAGLASLVTVASDAAGDRVTELPMHPEYSVCLESEIADMKNIGTRAAGTICAAVFLREFVGETPWVHLDIAGTGWNDQSDLTSVPKGPSGTPVRTFVELARRFSEFAEPTT